MSVSKRWVNLQQSRTGVGQIMKNENALGKKSEREAALEGLDDVVRRSLGRDPADTLSDTVKAHYESIRERPIVRRPADDEYGLVTELWYLYSPGRFFVDDMVCYLLLPKTRRLVKILRAGPSQAAHDEAIVWVAGRSKPQVVSEYSVIYVTNRKGLSGCTLEELQESLCPKTQ